MVARRWIEADGGRVEVMKKATRAGSTFVVTLPARVLPEPPPPESHWNLPASPIP
jgi:signal transduction histidine kinase